MARRDFGADAVNKASSGWLDDLDTVIQRGLSVTPQDFGAVGDGVTDDSAAFVAALAYLAANAETHYGYTYGASELFIPKGVYYLGTTPIDLLCQVRIRGAGAIPFGGGASVLKWAANTSGIRVQNYNTSGDITVDGVAHAPGSGSIIDGLWLQGAYTNFASEGDYHGIHMKARAKVINCNIYGFQGDGIYIHASAGAGSPDEGNANGFVIEDVLLTGCRNGIYIEGADANSGRTVGLKAYSNRRWGIFENCFLGNTHIAPETGDNGWGTAVTPTIVSHAGNWYSVVHGQETGAATNAPSGTTANNSWWIYVQAGVPDVANSIPAWTNGITVRSGGAIYAGAASNVFSNPYAEGGQGAPQFTMPTMVLNGAGIRTTAYHGDLSASASPAGLKAGRNFIVGEQLTALGSLHEIGPNTGTAADTTVKVYNTNTLSVLDFYSYLGGAGLLDARVASVRGQGVVLGGSDTVVINRIGIEDVATFNSGGLSLAPGKTYKINGTQVVGAQGAAVSADATDLPTALTLVNELKARLRAHGLIA